MDLLQKFASITDPSRNIGTNADGKLPYFNIFKRQQKKFNEFTSMPDSNSNFFHSLGVTYERYSICTSKRDRFRKDVTKGCGFLAVSPKSCGRFSIYPFYKYTQYFPLVIILE